MIDQPASPPLTLVAPGGDKIVLTDLRWPFAQLNAQGVPAELPVASPDVQLSLAVLAGQTPKGLPVLVKVNADGSITTSVQQLAGATFDVHVSETRTDTILVAAFNVVLAPGAALVLNSIIPGDFCRIAAWHGAVTSLGSVTVQLEAAGGGVFDLISTGITGFFNRPLYGAAGPTENGSGNGFIQLRNPGGVAAGGLTGAVIWYPEFAG